MFNSIKAKNEALLKLKEYNGINPQILQFKKEVILLNRTNVLNDFAVEYILTNYTT